VTNVDPQSNQLASFPVPSSPKEKITDVRQTQAAASPSRSPTSATKSARFVISLRRDRRRKLAVLRTSRQPRARVLKRTETEPARCGHGRAARSKAPALGLDACLRLGQGQINGGNGSQQSCGPLPSNASQRRYNCRLSSGALQPESRRWFLIHARRHRMTKHFECSVH